MLLNAGNNRKIAEKELGKMLLECCFTSRPLVCQIVKQNYIMVVYYQMYSKEQFHRVGLNNSRYFKEAACSLNNSCHTSWSLAVSAWYCGSEVRTGAGHPAGTTGATAAFIYPGLQPSSQMPADRERTHYPVLVAPIKGSSPLFIKILKNLIHKKLYEDKALIVL